MVKIIELNTERLRLRQWVDADFAPFAELNADPAVMEYFPSVLSEEQSNAMAAKCRSLIAERGWGFWALELKRSGEFVGFTGLHVPSASLPFSPCVEIGWRLAQPYWGNGYACEAATATLSFAFDALALPEVVSFTTEHNHRSRAVMERIGMSDTLQRFDHPDVDEISPLSRHVLYKINRINWK